MRSSTRLRSDDLIFCALPLMMRIWEKNALHCIGVFVGYDSKKDIFLARPGLSWG
jgi:hypothetical protein